MASPEIGQVVHWTNEDGRVVIGTVLEKRSLGLQQIVVAEVIYSTSPSSSLGEAQWVLGPVKDGWSYKIY